MHDQRFIESSENTLDEIRNLGESLQYQEFLFACERNWLICNDKRVLPLLAQAQVLLGQKLHAGYLVEDLTLKTQLPSTAVPLSTKS